MYLRYHDQDNLSQAEVIHEQAKKHLLSLSNSLNKNSHYFQSDNSLTIKFNDVEFPNPIGLASGFDKDCDLLIPNSYIFGLVTCGTILRNKNSGNLQNPKDGVKRVIINQNDKSIINSQGYPSEGLSYSINQLKSYSNHAHGKSKIILSFSGISKKEDVDDLLDNSKEIIKNTHAYVDGYEDSRSSPNTNFNKQIQTTEITEKIISLLNSHAPDKLKILKLSPYSSLSPSDEESNNKLNLIQKFSENGGDFVVLNNSLSINVTKSKNIKNFNNTFGGLSGHPIFPYTEKFVSNIHKNIPNLPIIACGGIHNGENAWSLINNGASMIQLYSGLTFYGLGLISEINKTIKKKLGDNTLQSFIETRNSKL